MFGNWRISPTWETVLGSPASPFLVQVMEMGGSPCVTSHWILGESPGLTTCCSGNNLTRGEAETEPSDRVETLTSSYLIQ